MWATNESWSTRGDRHTFDKNNKRKIHYVSAKLVLRLVFGRLVADLQVARDLVNEKKELLAGSSLEVQARVLLLDVLHDL